MSLELLTSQVVVEEWLSVEGFPNYAISNLGRVRNIVTGKLLRPTETGGQHKNSKRMYLGYRFNRDGKQYIRLAHRLVLLHFVGAPPEGTISCHKDDKGHHNCVANLYWGTKEQNEADRVFNKDKIYPPCDFCGFTVNLVDATDSS